MLCIALYWNPVLYSMIFYAFRCFFLSDKTSPSFSLHKSPYRQQLCQDLITNVYHSGAWGGFHSFSLGYADIPCTQTVDSHLLSLQWYVSCILELGKILSFIFIGPYSGDFHFVVFFFLK
jgi:hypothetical protein